MRLEAAHVEMDARNCYDRIIPDQAVITSHRHGMDYKSAVFIAIVLKILQHHIKVSTSTSEKYFTNQEKNKIYSTGQGTGWSTPIWGNTNHVIIKAMYDNYPQSIHMNPDRTIISKRNTDSFVEDTAAGCNKNAINSDTTVEIEIQKLAQKYERYLFLSGGKLAIQKCAF